MPESVALRVESKSNSKSSNDPKSKPTDKNDEVDEDSNLSPEDKQLKDTLEELVSTCLAPSTTSKLSNNDLFSDVAPVTEGVRKNALVMLGSEIKSATSSMTSVPKPLKFLRPHYKKLVAFYDRAVPVANRQKNWIALKGQEDQESVLPDGDESTLEDRKNKLKEILDISQWGTFDFNLSKESQKAFADVLSVLSMTMSPTALWIATKTQKEAEIDKLKRKKIREKGKEEEKKEDKKDAKKEDKEESKDSMEVETKGDLPTEDLPKNKLPANADIDTQVKFLEEALKKTEPINQLFVLNYKLEGNTMQVGEWGAEYVRSLAGQIGMEFDARMTVIEEQIMSHPEFDPDDIEKLSRRGKLSGLKDLDTLVDCVVDFHLNHNASAEAVDVLFETSSLHKLIEDGGIGQTYFAKLQDADDTTVCKVAAYMEKCAVVLRGAEDDFEFKAYISVVSKLYLTEAKRRASRALAQKSAESASESTSESMVVESKSSDSKKKEFSMAEDIRAAQAFIHAVRMGIAIDDQSLIQDSLSCL